MCLLVMLPIKRDTNVLTWFLKNVCHHECHIFLINTIFHYWSSGKGRKNEDSNQLKYFQLEDSLVVYSPIPLVQFESPNIIVPDVSESSSLNNENANSSLVLFHKDHDSNITNGKEIVPRTQG